MIEVVRAGQLNSVQDMGRAGSRHLGVCQSGALDRHALAIANLLAGNPVDAAALEVTLGPCELLFRDAGRIALGGADFAATLDGRPLAPWWSVPVRAGQRLTLRAARQGMRAYVALAGGIDVAIVLGARATDLQAGFGGLGGRALRAGDTLRAGPREPSSSSAPTSSPPSPSVARSPTSASAAARRFGIRAPAYCDGGADAPLPIRVMPGPDHGLFSAAAQRAFWDGVWTLTPHSNRMGFRLGGPVLARKKGKDLPSHGVLPGVIQVPPAGQPIVLMADAQTTGGYPKIGVVIQSDLAKLAQLRVHRQLRFVACDAAQAREALRQDGMCLRQIQAAMPWAPP